MGLDSRLATGHDDIDRAEKMHKIKSVSIDFEVLLALAPNPYIVLDRSLRIAWMNEAYLRATMRRREDIVGQPIFTAFPSDPSTESHRLLTRKIHPVEFQAGRIANLTSVGRM